MGTEFFIVIGVFPVELLDYQVSIPSSEALRTEETSNVQDSLQVNGYPTKFIENAAQLRSGPQSHHPDPAGLAVVPCVQGVSDRVKRTLQHFNIRTALSPYAHLLLSSKNRRTVHRKKK